MALGFLHSSIKVTQQRPVYRLNSIKKNCELEYEDALANSIEWKNI